MFALRLVSAAISGLVGFVPFFVFSFGDFIRKPDLCWFALRIYAVVVVVSFFRVRITRAVIRLYPDRVYAYQGDELKPRSCLVRFSLARIVGQTLLAAFFSLGWTALHVIRCMKGDVRWWDVPVGVAALYLLIGLAALLRASAMVVDGRTVWIYHWFGKFRVEIDERLLLLARLVSLATMSCLRRSPVGRWAGGPVTSSHLGRKFPQEIYPFRCVFRD